MSWKNQLLGQVGASVGSAANYYIGKATGANQGMANDQIEQQKKLTSIQEGANARAARNSLELQKEMIDYTNPSMTMKRLEDAGLNPALMYGQGGAGGTTTGSAGQSGVAGGTASDEASRKMTSIQQQGMALQMAKLQSEIDVNKSVAEANRANAGLSGAKQLTENEQRNLVIEKLRQEGIEKWLNNEITQFKMTGTESGSIRNPILKWYTSVSKDSMQFKEMNQALLKAIEETENIKIDTKYLNSRINGYLQELANATEQANASMINALANKLQAEFNTGTDVNWKNIGEVLIRLLGVLRR